MQQEYQIDASRRQCHLCRRRFQPLDEYVSVLRDADQAPTESQDGHDQVAGEGQHPLPGGEQLGDDQPAADQSAADQPADDQSAADQSAADQSAADQPEPAATKPAAATRPAAVQSSLGLVREDYCPGCAPEERAASVAVWHSRVAPPEAAKKRRGLIIDEARLLEVFFRLAGDQDEARLDFRYVIALMLIRKRKLKVEGSRRRAGGVRVTMVRKPRTKELHELIDRNLSDEAVIKVSQDIGDLLDLVDGQPVGGPDQEGESENAAE